jgi:hypothetical protein
LPSVTLGKEHSANISSAKGSFAEYFFRTLGKDFAECQKALGEEKHSANISSAQGSFAEYFFRTLGKDFAECQKALGKEKHSAN